MQKIKLHTFYKAIFESNEEQVLQMITENTDYILHGGLSYSGKKGFLQMLKDMKKSSMENAEIEHLITDKNYGAVKGTLTLKNGTKMPFCEFITFAENEKIQRIESFLVPSDIS